MQVQKGIAVIIGEETNDFYKMKTTCVAEIFIKNDGNYNETIAKINDRKFELFDISSLELIETQHSYDEFFKIYPGFSLTAFYDSLSIPNYTVSYEEPLVVI